MTGLFEKHRNLVFTGLLLILGAAIYSNTWHASFQFDDRFQILSNWSLHQFPNIPAIWSSNVKTRFLPYVSFAYNIAVDGSNVTGYHLFNFTIHFLNALWVYRLVLLLLATPKMQPSIPRNEHSLIAGLAALIFISHPLQTQAVTYLVQRLASMAAFFYLGAIVFYLKARLTKHKFYYFSALAMTAAAMVTKENAFTLPLALVLIEGMFFGFSGQKRRAAVRLFPFLLTLLMIPYFTYIQNSKEFLLATTTQAPPRADYLLTQMNVLCTYLRLFFVPLNQNLDYDYPLSHSLLDPKTFFCFSLLAGFFIAGLLLLKKNRLAAFSIFWFFLTLSVESSIIPIDDVIFEHRMYLPMAGFALLPVLALRRLLKDPSRFIIVGTAITLVFSSMTYARNRIWKDEISLWSDVLKKSPRKVRIYNNLGIAYADQGDSKKALSLYEQAIRIDPLYANSFYNLGLYYAGLNDWKKAIPLYEKAIELDPKYYVAYNNLGTFYAQNKDMDRAATLLEKAIKISPDYVTAYDNLATVYRNQGKIGKAIETFQKAIEINPYYAPPYFRLGLILGEHGDMENALGLFQKSSNLNPHYAEPVLASGEIYLSRGDLNAARQQVGKLLVLQRNDLAQNLNDAIEKKSSGPAPSTAVSH